MVLVGLTQTKLNEIVRPIVRKAKERCQTSDFLPPSYRVSIALPLARYVRDKTLQKQKDDGASKGGACAGVGPLAGEKHRDYAQTGRSMLARLVGWKSATTLQKAIVVCTAAKTDPRRFGHLKAEMDQTSKVKPVYRKYLTMKTCKPADKITKAMGQVAATLSEAIAIEGDDVTLPERLEFAVVVYGMGMSLLYGFLRQIFKKGHLGDVPRDTLETLADQITQHIRIYDTRLFVRIGVMRREVLGPAEELEDERLAANAMQGNERIEALIDELRYYRKCIREVLNQPKVEGK